MRISESGCTLIHRLGQIDLSDSQRLAAVENARRAERFAALLFALATGVAKLAEIVVVKPVRRGVSLLARWTHRAA